MKNSLIKSIIVVLSFIGGLFIPDTRAVSPKATILISLIAFLFGVIIPQLFVFNSLYNKVSFSKPKWKDKFETQKPLVSVQFLAVLILFSGAGLLIGGANFRTNLDFTGVFVTSLGAGMLAGIFLLANRANFFKGKAKS